jgi:hypothetical protein
MELTDQFVTAETNKSTAVIIKLSEDLIVDTPCGFL